MYEERLDWSTKADGDEGSAYLLLAAMALSTGVAASTAQRKYKRRGTWTHLTLVRDFLFALAESSSSSVFFRFVEPSREGAVVGLTMTRAKAEVDKRRTNWKLL